MACRAPRHRLKPLYRSSDGVLAHLAAATTRIRLGAAVVSLSLHHPVRIAEQAALADALSDGRLELGIGRRFAPADYDGFGLDRRDSDRLFHTHHEKLTSLLNSNVETAQIPTWLATTGNQQTLDLAVKHGHGSLVAVSRQAAEREIRPYLSWYIEQLANLQPSALSPALNDVLGTSCVVGTNQECHRQLHALRVECGLTDLVAVFGIGGMDPETGRFDPL